MKRLLVVTGLLVLGAFLVFSLVSAQTNLPTGLAPAVAQDPVAPSAVSPRSSHTLVQNMEALTANLHVAYYFESGQVATQFDDVLPPNGSKTYHAANYPELGASFLGSMVVSSDRQIVAVVINAGSTSHDIYEGANAGALEEFLPSVHWRAGQYTLAGFQNTDPAVTATVAITYYLQNGTPQYSTQVNLPPNTALHQDARNYPLGPTAAPGGVGSIKATSLTGQKIALAAVEVLGDETNSYRGFTADQAVTDTIYLPSIHRNMSGQLSHTLVQNLSGSDNNVRITYYRQDGSFVAQFDQTIAGNGAYTFHTGNNGPQDPTGLGNVGSATVQSMNGQKMLAVVLETIGSTIYSYDGQTKADAASALRFPSVHHNLGGQFSHTLIQNLSSGQSANLHVYYYRQDGTVANDFTKVLAPSGSYTFHTTPGADLEPLNLGNVGSLRVVCDNCNNTGGPQIVGVMIETITSSTIPAAYAGFKEY